MKKVLTMKNYRVMKNYMKYICAFLMMVGISTSVWGTSSSFDGLSSITVNSVDWGTSTTSLSKYIGYDNGSIVTSATATVWFQLYIGDEFENNSLFAFIEDPTDGFGISITASGSPVDNVGGYINYVCSKSAGYCYNLEVGDEIEINLQYVITSPRTSHTATLKFKTYDDEDLVDVLSIPITINMTGGYTVATAVSPSATGSVTAKVGGSARTRVMSNEKLDLVATPEDGYMFTGWAGSDGSNIIFDDEDAASTFAYLSGNQTITATFDVACTSRSITMSDFSKDFGSADFVPTHTVSAGSGTKTWTSSNTDVATIVDGKVHIVAAGTTTIGLTVATDDPYCAVSKNCTMTVNALVPTVTAFTGTSTTPTSITLMNAQVSNKGGAAITAYGYIYSTTASTTEVLRLGESGVSTATVASADIAASTNFASKTVSELTTGTTYYVRAYATNSAGTGYSAIQSVKTIAYTDYKFSCADWTLTGPSGDIVFITSAANKTVRSQEAFHVSGNGLPHETALTFTTFPVNAKFEFKKADGSAISTDEYGVVDADVYVFYTPGVGDTSDGLDEITSLTVSVTGEPRTATIATKRVIGRHLPANFVIAVKYTDNQWYALPADLGSASNPSPVAIRVNNESNPTIAYCANTNSYTLYQDNVSNSQKVILGTTNNKNGSGVSYALWGSAGDNTLGINTSVVVTGSPGDQYKWTLTQTATSISTIADAKYNIRVSGNSNDLKLWTNAGLTKWGSYASGVKELRLLTLSEVAPMTMKVMEWGTNAIVVSYPNGGSATSPQVRIGDGDAANVTLTSLGGDIYKIATISGLQDNPAKTLTITATESGTGKQALFPIPLIVTTAKTEAELRTAAGSNDVAKLTDVVIRNGGRVTTGTNSGNFNDIYIYPGGKAKITNNFAANNIYMRGGYSFLDEKESFRYPDLCVEGAVTIDLPAAGKLYYDFYIDNRKYYMFSMPYDVTLSTVTDETGSEDFPVWVKHYDGNLRASGHGVSGWTWYGDEEGQGSFFAGIGYEITAQPKTSGRPIAIIRFPVITGDITTDAENSPGVTVTYYGKSAYEAGTQTANNVGWNFIGNPYLTEYKAVSDTDMIVRSSFVQQMENDQWTGSYEWKVTTARFITVPYDTYNDYHHELVKNYTIPAFSTFFFQFADDATGTFHMGGTRPQAALAPARFGATPKATPEISLDIMLSGTGEAEEGKAGLIIHESYDGGLKDFEDVEQWFVGNNVQKTYTFASGTALAYNLLNEEAINELIPMGYIATVGGEHVYALNEENDVSALEHLWLIDYTTGVTTDLLVRNYSFVTAAGRFDSRFAINAVLKQEEVPTDISNTPGGDWATTIGVYSDENMLTLRGLPDNSTVYIFDMSGRLLQSSEKLSNIASFSIATQGVYNIRVIAEGKAITLRTVLR